MTRASIICVFNAHVSRLFCVEITDGNGDSDANFTLKMQVRACFPAFVGLVHKVITLTRERSFRLG